MTYDRKIPVKSKDLSAWYLAVVAEAELADYGPAKGTIIYRPYGYRIWELAQGIFDSAIKAKGVDNAYFPLLIPNSLIQKEKSHVEGFSPELAVVTVGGGEALEEPLVVRPTSETIMYEAYSRWIQSWRDLPLMINQWNNVVRWEKRTLPFIRTSEFLWQEGHTAHATHKEAKEMQSWAIQAYASLYRDAFALPGYIGRKSESEKFAGAQETYTYESLMPDGKALQSCTSHDLAQIFSKPFDISYQNEAGGLDHVWQTSWGLSTRSLGGLVMAHGDDQGLRLPPNLAPVQIVVIPVRVDNKKILEYCEELAASLRKEGLRVEVDGREEESFGFKLNKWELRGVPLRLEIGPKEMETGQATLVRRDEGKKIILDEKELVTHVERTLRDIHEQLYKTAEKFLKQNTHSVDEYAEFKKIMAGPRGFIAALWCEDEKCEEEIKAETKATTRCLPLDSKDEVGKCVKCNKPAKHRWLFAQAY